MVRSGLASNSFFVRLIQSASKGSGGIGFKIRAEFAFQTIRILEWKILGELVDEKIERIDDGHVSHQIDRDLQRFSFLREHQTGDPVAERILLPVQKMSGGFDVERIAENGRAAMRGRTQSNLVRPEVHCTVKAVARLVIERNADGH